jgi:phage terminase large subunit
MNQPIDLGLTFQPRCYQLPIWEAMKSYNRLILIMPRRSGKDVLCFNIIYREALKKVGSYYYVFPTFSSGRRILWDQITMDGERILDYIPRNLIESKNESMMRIKLINGSYIQIIGSDNFDNTLVGTNPRGIVFSEYALQSPEGYAYSIPILRANDGWAIFQSTPRGRNHFYELWKIAQQNPDVWFSYRLTVRDTQHVNLEQIQSDVDRGEISQDLVEQEYYCSFDQGISGSFYQNQLDRMRLNFQIGIVPWEPTLKVHTAWDIGVRDSTVIIFFQNHGATIRVIDYYEKSSEGLEHYVKLINSKPYIYGVHLAPHDIGVKEFGTGMTRIEIAKKMGLNFTIVRQVALMDGIESVRAALAKIYIDEAKCKSLVKALENYRREYDTDKKVYKATPLHDIYSHAADAMRYLCVGQSKTRDGLSSEALDQLYKEAVYGNTSQPMPSVFRDDFNNYF